MVVKTIIGGFEIEVRELSCSDRRGRIGGWGFRIVGRSDMPSWLVNLQPRLDDVYGTRTMAERELAAMPGFRVFQGGKNELAIETSLCYNRPLQSSRIPREVEPMASGTLPKPGTKFGPCVDACGHRDCAHTRKMAATLCLRCEKAIDYDVAFYSVNGPLVHAACEHASIEGS